jgi:hypothetical protein
LTPETNVLEGFFKRHHELLLIRLVATTAQQHDFLITAASHGFQSDDNGDILGETILSKVNLVVLGCHITF